MAGWLAGWLVCVEIEKTSMIAEQNKAQFLFFFFFFIIIII